MGCGGYAAVYREYTISGARVGGIWRYKDSANKNLHFLAIRKQRVTTHMYRDKQVVRFVSCNSVAKYRQTNNAERLMHMVAYKVE